MVEPHSASTLEGEEDWMDLSFSFPAISICRSALPHSIENPPFVLFCGALGTFLYQHIPMHKKFPPRFTSSNDIIISAVETYGIPHIEKEQDGRQV